MLSPLPLPSAASLRRQPKLGNVAFTKPVTSSVTVQRILTRLMVPVGCESVAVELTGGCLFQVTVRCSQKSVTRRKAMVLEVVGAVFKTHRSCAAVTVPLMGV